MVLQYATYGNFNNWLYYYNEIFNYFGKYYLIKYILEGLEVIHQNKMVHCDFHTGNILIDASEFCDVAIPKNIQISDMGYVEKLIIQIKQKFMELCLM
jgi:serine/threonine protein kinase